MARQNLTGVPRNVWLLASTLTAEVVGVDGRYPHICNTRFPKERTISGVQDLIFRSRDCVACARSKGLTVS